MQCKNKCAGQEKEHLCTSLTKWNARNPSKDAEKKLYTIFPIVNEMTVLATLALHYENWMNRCN